MPELLAFAGLRPNTAITGPLDDVICPPYDIITEGQRVELLGRSPFNVVRVELPDGRYSEAATLFDEWKNDGALGREATPALYAYRMTYQAPGGEARHTFGVMGALVLEPPGHGILPHEQTTPKAKGDRLELIRAVHANTSPIWCLCTEPGLVEALGGPPGPRVSEAKAAIASARDDDGTLHEIWPIDDERARQEVANIVAARPLLVADGHHRYETALAYQAEQRAAVLSSGGDAGGGGPATTHYWLSWSSCLRSTSRSWPSTVWCRACRPISTSSGFWVTASSSNRPPADEGDLLAEMVRKAPWPWPRKAAIGWRGLAPEGPTLAMSSIRAAIDATLHRLPPHALVYEHDPGRALAEVRSGAANAAVLCRPATVGQIARTAEGGERMPPKTTFFWPKPRTGMVFRDFARA